MSIERGLLLYQQSRFEMAESELRQGLASDPDDSYAHAILSLCLIERKQYHDATDEAERAVHLAPDFAFAHYALAKSWYDREHLDKARASINEAIRLDPGDANHRFLLSAIHVDERQWAEALRVAEDGLELDPEHAGCTNLRAMALVKLGRTHEAGQTIDDALARDPQNSVTHANRGWTVLERGDPNEAAVHFREALRLDPENDWARTGMVEALKARNPIYAVMLRYFLWMASLTSRAQWGVIIGGYFINRLLTVSARTNPELAPWLLPFRIIFIVFVLLTWTAQPLFNLLLRLDPFGRHALSRDEVVESNWVGSLLLLGLLALGGSFVWGFESPFLLAAMVFGLLLIPLSAVFKAPLGWPRTAITVYTAVLSLVGLAAIVASLPGVRSGDEPAWGVFLIFVLGAAAAPWVANILISRRPRR